MPVQIRWNLSVEVADGPKVTLGEALAVEAFDKIEAKILSTGATVDLQPSDDVQFLLITSNLYSDQITYEVDGGGAADVKLDAPQLLVGAGAIGLLEQPPKKLIFTNAIPAPTPEPLVTILIGRAAAA
jgi:hypothetical protein